MKRRAGLMALMAGTLVLGWLVSPLGAATKSVIYNSVAQTFTALQTFSSGVAVSSGVLSVAAGGTLNLEGQAGDTYLKRDVDTGCWQEWKDGALAWQHCSNYAVPPDCATDTSSLPFGGLCKNQTTGEVLVKTGSGLIALTGSAR